MENKEDVGVKVRSTVGERYVEAGRCNRNLDRIPTNLDTLFSKFWM